MKLTNNNKRQGFTLIEMVGVLAIIAILAALLVPKIFAAINESRFSNTVASINSVKAACMNYFGRTGALGTLDDVTYDSTLLQAGLLERPFACKIGDSAIVQVKASVGAVAGTTYCYALDGTTPIPAGSTVVEIELTGVSADDALELSKRIDGDNALSALAAGKDTKGRVTYDTADAAKKVHVYLAHK